MIFGRCNIFLDICLKGLIVDKIIVYFFIIVVFLLDLLMKLDISVKWIGLFIDV